MDFFLGIDGGGTSIKALIGDADRKVLGSLLFGPANYHGVGIERVKENFISLFNYCSRQYNIPIKDIKRICMGCAGIDNEKDERIYTEMLDSLGYKGELIIYNDAFVALVGANGGVRGAVLVSGTGSIAYGIGSGGRHVRTGGWGNIIGDEGSAYAIARDALNAITRSFDGIIPYTELIDIIMNRLSIRSPKELLTYIYDPNTKKQHIAELAPLVLEAAASDKVAQFIVEKAAHDLYQMVYGLKKKMNVESFQLALSGSILMKSEVIRKPLINEIKVNLPQIEVYCRYSDPAYGALLMAWKEAAAD